MGFALFSTQLILNLCIAGTTQGLHQATSEQVCSPVCDREVLRRDCKNTASHNLAFVMADNNLALPVLTVTEKAQELGANL